MALNPPYSMEKINKIIDSFTISEKVRFKFFQCNSLDSDEFRELCRFAEKAKKAKMTLEEYVEYINAQYYKTFSSLIPKPQTQIIEKPVEVIKEVPVEIIKEIPVVDPKQQAKIAELEKQLNTIQNQQSSVIIEPEEKEPEIELIELTKEQKKEFKKLVKSGEKSFAEIAAEYGYDENTLRLSVL